MDKVIITVVGTDRTGIIARVSAFLYEENINILDISQTITGGIFNMMLIADFSSALHEFPAVYEKLGLLGDEIGVRILAQKAEIFEKMHRV